MQALFFAFALAASAAAPNAEQVLETLGVREGGTVCEVGAGDGSMSIEAARILGPNGRVFANELENRVQRLRDKVAGEKRITVVVGEAAKTNFPDAGCDGIFLRDVYHHVTDPVSLNEAIAAALKPGGRVAIVDFTPPSKEAAQPADRAKNGSHGVTPEAVVREMKAAGFAVLQAEPPSQRWFLVVVAKPGS